MQRSPYSAVRPTARRNTWQWHRPNGDRVALYGFNHHQIAHIAPALHATDVHLRPEHHLNAYAHVKKPKLFSAFSRATQPKHAAITYANRPFKKSDKIEISGKVFHKKSTLHPAGVFAHELGHLVGPDSRKGHRVSHQQLGEFRESFGYRPGGFIRKNDVSKYGKTKNNILKGRKTRQAHNAHEDFAETFRTTLGIPITTSRTSLKHRNYLHTTVDAKRQQYLRKHYIW